ncbi:Fe-S cluster assembly protein SufD, partial [Bacillus thuringiensis]|nr:Fe-S cluster assembly protein SufD [Bacillus thuringiensis]
KINSRFSAPGANCELDGLYLAGDGQLVDYHLGIDHAVPGCSSRENFKGILTGQGRAVFDGRILVRERAQKSDAHLSNANLMLS